MSDYREQDVWHPSTEIVEGSNLAGLMQRLGHRDYDAFLAATAENSEPYWNETLRHLDIVFDPPARRLLDDSEGPMWARFFPGAGFNAAEASLRPPVHGLGAQEPAVMAEDEAGTTTILSYEQLSTRVRALAGGLVAIGAQRGDRIGLYYPSTADAVVTMLAICYMGAIVVPLYSGFGPEAVQRRLEGCGAKFLAAADGFQRKGRTVSLAKVAIDAVAAVPGCQLILAHDGAADAYPAAHHHWHDLLRHAPLQQAAPTLADEPAMIIYTSGTSGKPKGTVHRHGGFPLRVAQDNAFVFDFRPSDRYFWPADMGWMVGPHSTFSALLNKGALVLFSGAPDTPDVGRLRQVIARQGVTHFGTSPTAIRGMAAAEAIVLEEDVPTLRIMMTGGEVIDVDSHVWMVERFGGGKLPLINYTGGTECAGALLTNVVVRPIAPCRFNSTAPGVDAVVLDDRGEAVVGQAGELAIRKPFNGMAAGFWEDRERYLETYWSRFPDIWVHGDLAIQEESGQYLLIGRSDDVMKISGRRVGPSEIEGSVVDGRMVREALAFGVPDAKTGEAMIVLAIPGPDGESNPERVTGFVVDAIRKHMGASFRPQTVLTLSELIKTKNGKLVRRLARQAWLDEPAGDLTSIENPEAFDRLRARFAALRDNA